MKRQLLELAMMREKMPSGPRPIDASQPTTSRPIRHITILQGNLYTRHTCIVYTYNVYKDIYMYIDERALRGYFCGLVVSARWDNVRS